MISCDLDGLKIVNDTMGHNYGDKLLILCSALIKDALREGDTLARIGGDEFAAILPNTDFSTGEKIVNRIYEKISKYNQEHKDLIISISIGISTTLDEAKSLEKVLKDADDKMYHEKLIQKRSSRSQIINSLMAALAEKDFITEGHSQRLSYFTEKMARKLGLPNDVITNLNLLAQVHDLGKVGIPEQILLKPGKLEEDEWEIMRQHSEKGFRIAITSPDLSQIADLILKHHEKWDGTGYPLGVKGEEIPIECRILAIVDAYDAMTNDRPYSKARDEEEALNEISMCSGTQFDPYLTKIFLEIVKNERKNE
jgi:diguanylate cyclase (GGDEF)-like protein